MRIWLAVVVLISGAGCTPRAWCNSLTPGQEVPTAARRVERDLSWCGSHPAREHRGSMSRSTLGELFEFGEFDAEGTEQCCVYAEGGRVVATWIGYD
jgi:hypothetical protein